MTDAAPPPVVPRGFEPVTENEVPIEEIRQFLDRETELLDDSRRLREWSELLSDDFVYEVPVRVWRSLQSKAATFPRGSLAIYEDKASIDLRVIRLESGEAHGEETPTLMRRIVSGVRATRLGDDEFAVRSAFLLYHNRHTIDGELLAGERNDVVRIIDGRFFLARREVRLDHLVVPTQNVTIFF